MKKFLIKDLNQCLKDIPNNFGPLIDFIIHYDSINEDFRAWKIIHAIEAIDNETLVALMIDDFKTRDLSKSPKLLYNSILYGLVNNAATKQILLSSIPAAGEKFQQYLHSLNENNEADGEKNIAEIFKNLEQKGKL